MSYHQSSKILLVDDEASFRSVAKGIIKAHFPKASIGEADSLTDALAKLPQMQPDLLLLDIDLGDGNAFELLDRLPARRCKIAFVTAHDEFAIKAFKYNAIDYLLKPVLSNELVDVVHKSLNNKPLLQSQQLMQLKSQVRERQFEYLTLQVSAGLVFARLAEIIRFEACGNYSHVLLQNGEKYLASNPLAYFEEILPSPPFFRAHQSHLINIAHVRKLHKDEGDQIQMTDKSAVPLARRRKEEFLDIMG